MKKKTTCWNRSYLLLVKFSCPYRSRSGRIQQEGGIGLGAAFSVDFSGGNIEVDVFPETPFCAPTLCLRGDFGVIQLYAASEHLAEVEFALRTYLDGIRYPETPDQQAVLNHESTKSIEEEIA